MAGKRVGGTIFLKSDGLQLQAKGNFTYDIGKPKKEAVTGFDGVHGFKETPKPAFIEGEITDSLDLDLGKLFDTVGATINLELAVGKSIVLRDAWYAGDGTGETEEGNIKVRFEAPSGEETKG
jgi:hypothetical protein